jgi:hypothetical protein
MDDKTTVNSLVYELLELRRAYIKDTDPISKRLVINWMQSQRARLLKQKFDQPFSSIDDHYVQSLGSNISMEKVLSNEGTALAGDSTYMYRTNIDIPRTIESKTGIGTFTRVGPRDRLSEKFKVVTYDRALVSGNGKFNHNTIYAFVLGDRLYLTSKSGIHLTTKYIDIRGVFQDPIAAALINAPAWDYDDDYPINKEIIDQLKVLIINEKFGLTLIQAGDKRDDKEDNPDSPSTAQKQIQIPNNQNAVL